MSQLLEMFERVYRDRPDRVLLHAAAPERGVTARQLWDSAAALVKSLQRIGIGRGSLAMLGTGNDPSTCAAWLACRRLDAAVMPLDRTATPAEIAHVIEAYQPAVSLVQAGDDQRGELVGGLRMVPTPGGSAGTRGFSGAAVLKLTSGTSGLKKAVWTTEPQFVADGARIIEGMGIGADDVQVGVIPLSHSYGMGSLLLPLLMQGTTLILRSSFIPHQLVREARRHDARVFCGVPFMFEHLVRNPPAGGWPRGLRLLVAAGAPLDMSTQTGFLRAFGVKVHPFYGTSETGGIAFDASDTPPTESTVGTPLPGVSLTLRPFDLETPDVGQVHVRSSSVARGYIEAATADAPFQDGFLTEDLGRFNHGGRLVLTGRISAFINVAGRKVQPEEVESVLRSMPGIADAQVLGLSDSHRGEQLVACVVPAGPSPTVFDVRRHCSRYLAPHKVPRQVLVLEALPRTERGKPDRRALLRLVLQNGPGPPQVDVT